MIQRSTIPMNRISRWQWNEREIPVRLFPVARIITEKIRFLPTRVCAHHHEIPGAAETFVSNTGRDHHDVSRDNLDKPATFPAKIQSC